MEILNFIYLSTSWSFENLMVLGYIDPGTGSIIIQAIVAAVVGLGIAIKLFWHRILKFLGIRKTINTDDSGKSKSDK